MNPSIEKRRALGHMRPCFGGDSSTASTTNIFDKRVVGGDGSTNLSADVSGTLVMNQTDHGAVSGGVALGTQAIDAATKAAAGTQASAQSMFKDALATVKTTQESAIGAVNQANERLTDAYQQGQAGDQTTLKYAGFIVVGLAALAFVAGKK